MNDWERSEKFVLEELRRLGSNVEKMTIAMNKLALNVAIINAKAKMEGARWGVITSIAMIVAAEIILHSLKLK